jgi:hypothetical protein
MVAVRSMLYMGLRECEALSMLWTGFDQDRRVYTAVDTARIYAMNPELLTYPLGTEC